MAIPKQLSTTLLLLALATLSFTTTSNAADCSGAGAISVYWGQRPSDQDESTLQSACETGNYKIVILESLIVHDDGTTPELNLAGHCGSSTNPCTKLQPEIEYCQQKGIKVILSIGQDRPTLKTGNRHYRSAEAAQELATYLLENYLSGKAGPLGNVALDGIDIADVADGDNLKWDEVVTAINASTTARKIYLSASPQCVYPDYYLGKAIETGLFDYIWVEFFNPNPDCIYANNDASKLLSAWNTWTKNVPSSSIFLGLAASEDVVGYVAPEVVVSEILPSVKLASNYGGVMIWDRYSDKQSDYSTKIKDSVGKDCKCVCDGDAFASKSFYGLGSKSLPL
ncbi:acidic endochitinase [Cajanus cajan]|uniref:Acidic endochitinase n=1 Tax=Cajanus cajan TaxID=3821 RepID=A0A151S757_CAJCA|nr:acidic endochitinase [Cajanus cajan]KYP50597.1 Acidic endochitinase [Cajanus cajan]